MLLIKEGETGLEKGKIIKNSLIKKQNGNLFHTLAFSQVFSTVKWVYAATVKSGFGIVPGFAVSSW